MRAIFCLGKQFAALERWAEASEAFFAAAEILPGSPAVQKALQEIEIKVKEEDETVS